MVRTTSPIVKPLVLYLVLAPFAGPPARAQGSGPPADPPPPAGPPAWAGPDETPFTAVAKPITMRAFNGFRADTTPGLFRHRRHNHTGGVSTIESPWGERLEIRYWRNPHGITLEYDRALKVRYRFDEAGELAQIIAETPGQQATMAVGNRSELAYLGLVDFTEFDMSAYALIDQTLRTNHSEEFLDGLGEFDGPAEASCFTQGLQCGACIITWAASVAAISAACTAGSAVTFGAACLAAILSHEATNLACAATCISWVEDCFKGSPDGAEPIPDGCEP